MATQRLVLKHPARPTPFAFPLMVERFREQLSNESVADRISRMVAQLEKAAGGDESAPVDEVRERLTFGGAAPQKTAPRARRRARR